MATEGQRSGSDADECHARDLSVRTLLDVPDELLEMVGIAVLAADPRGALCLCQASCALQTKLERLRALVETRRLRWLADLTVEHAISDHGRTLLCTSRKQLPRTCKHIL